MKKNWRELTEKVSRLFLTEEETAVLEKLKAQLLQDDTGFGYDMFGAEYEWFLLYYCAVKIAYEKYFRVESYGHENIPKEGPVILASNHSGVLPLDGGIIPVDVFKKLDPPRIVRAIAENLFAKLPYASYIMHRMGFIIGVRRNFDEVLKKGQIVLVFPEGIRGMGKPFWKRYKLMPFNVGHVELSVEKRAPVVPVAVVGAEEQMPVVYNWKKMGEIVGLNAFPITFTWPWLGPLGLIPLPTKYYIYYGKPFYFHEEDPNAVEKAEVIKSMAGRVQNAVQEMLNEGRQRRPGIFF